MTEPAAVPGPVAPPPNVPTAVTMKAHQLLAERLAVLESKVAILEAKVAQGEAAFRMLGSQAADSVKKGWNPFA